MCQISRDAFHWPPVYDNPSYSITVRWISLNFNDPSYGMLRRMSFDRWSLSPALPASPFLISSFAIFVFRRSPLAIIIYTFISPTTLAPSFYKFTSFIFLSILFLSTLFITLLHFSSLLYLVFSSPLAKFFSSLLGVIASSFCREVHLFISDPSSTSVASQLFSSLAASPLLWNTLPLPFIVWISAFRVINYIYTSSCFSLFHFSFSFLPSNLKLRSPSSSFFHHSSLPFLFITVYFVFCFSLCIFRYTSLP